MFSRKYLTKLLTNTRNHYKTVSNVKQVTKDKLTITKQLYAKIRSTGPITIADYMKEVLINPLAGYYMHRDVFGRSGDFITSPELSQMFGEMVAIWFLNEWSKIGSPKPFQIIELGPGRGTLSYDLLKVFNHFDALKGASLELVEVSPALADLQAMKLCMQSKNLYDPNSIVYREGLSQQGIPVRWYRQLGDVPGGKFTLLIAHEFFDALPIHKFQKTDQGFREVLIDLDPVKDSSFRFILAKDATPASKLFIKSTDKREHIETSPQSLILIKQIAERLESDGGLALIADYGNEVNDKDTFRAFKNHKLHDPLIEPGTADLTADVDFNGLKEAATENGGVIAFGPVTQHNFLLEMGIEHRFKALEEAADEVDLEGLRYSYHMMVDEDKMGTRFKFLSLIPSVLEDFLKKFPVVGFNKG